MGCKCNCQEIIDNLRNRICSDLAKLAIRLDSLEKCFWGDPSPCADKSDSFYARLLKLEQPEKKESPKKRTLLDTLYWWFRQKCRHEFCGQSEGCGECFRQAVELKEFIEEDFLCIEKLKG